MVTPLAARRLIVRIFQTESLPLEDVQGTVSLINRQGQEVLDFTDDYGVWMESDRMLNEVSAGVYDIELHPSDVLPNVFYRLVLTNTRNGLIMSTIDFEMPSGSGDITLSEIVGSVIPTPDTNRILAFINKFPSMFIDGQILVGDAAGNLMNEVPGIATIPDGSIAEIKFTAEVVTKLNNTPDWILNNTQIPANQVATGTATENYVPTINASGNLAYMPLQGVFNGVYSSIPGDDVGHDGQSALIETNPPAWAVKESGSWGVVYTWPAGGGGTGTTFHNGANIPTALLGGDGDYYIRRPGFPPLSNPPELYLKNNGTWGRIIQWPDGNKFRGALLADVATLDDPQIGEWYIQRENANPVTWLRFYERIGDQNAANWNLRFTFNAGQGGGAPTLAEIITAMAGSTDATADYVWALDSAGENPTWRAVSTSTPVTLMQILNLLAGDSTAGADRVLKLDSSGANPAWRADAGGSVTQANVYEQLKAILQNSGFITLTENDTDDELTVGGFVHSTNYITGSGTDALPLGVNILAIFEDAFDGATDRNSSNILDEAEIYMNDDGDAYKASVPDFATWAFNNQLERMQDAVARMFTHNSAYSYDDTNGEIDTTFPEADASGIVRVYNGTGLSANRDSSNDIVHEFTIPDTVVGERVAFYALWDITTIGTDSGGSVGACWLSVQQSGVIASNDAGSFIGQRNLGNGVTDTETGDQYVEGAEYIAFNSSQNQSLYIHRPGAGANDPSVRFNLQVFMARTKVAAADFTPFSGRYGDLLDRPIFRVSNEAAIPTPSAATVGRRYQTNAGNQYVIERDFVAGADRVLNFEAYPTAADAYQGAVNRVEDTSPGTLTATDAGKWWMIREWLNTGSAPFALVDSSGFLTSQADIPDTGYNYLGRYRNERAAEADAGVEQMSVVIYPDASGDEQLYRPDSTFVAGTPAHSYFVIVAVDATEHMHQVADAFDAQIGNLTIWRGDQAAYDAISDYDDNTLYLVTA